MPGRPSSPFLRLPKQWNTRIRSAVLHAIASAQVRGRRGQRLDLCVRELKLAGPPHRIFRVRLLLGRSLSDYFDRSDAIPRNILDHVLDFFWSRMAHEDVKPQGWWTSRTSGPRLQL